MTLTMVDYSRILQTCRVYDAHIDWLLTDTTNVSRLRRSHIIWGYWFYKHVASATLTLIDYWRILQTFRVYDAHTFFGVIDTTNMSRLRRSHWLITDGFYKHVASTTLTLIDYSRILQTCRVYDAHIGWLLIYSTNIPRLRRSYLIWGYWFYKHVASATLTLIDYWRILQTCRVYDAHIDRLLTDSTNVSRLWR